MPLNFLHYAVPHNNHYTFLIENIIEIISSFIPAFLSFLLHPISYSIPSFLNMIVLFYNETSN
jgi:hypothetical protein